MPTYNITAYSNMGNLIMLELIQFADGHYEKIIEEGDETFFTDATPAEIERWERIQQLPGEGEVTFIRGVL